MPIGNSNVVTVVVGDDIDGFIRRLKRVRSSSVRKSIMIKAMRSGLKPIKTLMKRQIRRAKAVGSKTLVKSINDKFISYPNGNAFGVIGAKRKKSQFSGVTVNPANYIHLVELGTQQHTRKGGQLGVWKFFDKVKREFRSLKGSIHPGAQPKPFRENTIKSHQFSGARVKFAKRFGMLLTAALKKQG